MGELQAKVSEALELGLLKEPENGELTREQMLISLQEIVARTDATLAVSATTISDAVRELNALEGEESGVSHQLTSLRRRLTEMGRIQESAANYREALRIQRDRLQISDWLGQHRTGEEDCPVCGGHLEPSEEKLAELRASLKDLELQAGDTFEIPAAFDRECSESKRRLMNRRKD
jgi:DNA repair exonuclease SbcCD ATPase subunit